jgi:hypothetical protein
LAGITDTTEQTAALRGLLDTVIAEHQTLGQVRERTLPEIPATVPPPALTAATDGHDPWGSDPDSRPELDDDTDHLLGEEHYPALRTALAAVLALDPVTAAGEITAAHSAHLAGECLTGAQRLARMAQLLKALR